MGLKRGRDVLISLIDDSEPDESLYLLAGIRARSITLSARPVETTTAESPQAWRELMAGAGTKRIEVAGSGAFINADSDERLRDAYFAGETPPFRLDVADFGVLKGRFAITELSFGGEHDGEATFSIRLASAGVISFALI